MSIYDQKMSKGDVYVRVQRKMVIYTRAAQTDTQYFQNSFPIIVSSKCTQYYPLKFLHALY
jgi:hypothetical protein